jgi:hypothetical protein
MPLLEIIDNLHAPEIYSAEIAGYTIAQGNITLTLATTRATWSEATVTNKRVIVARIVLSLGAAQALSVELFDFLKKHGLNPAQKPDDTIVQ